MEQKEDEAVAKFLLDEPEFLSILRSTTTAKGMEGVLTKMGSEVAGRFEKIAAKIKGAPSLPALNQQLHVQSGDDLKKLGGEQREAEKIAFEELKAAALKRLVDSLATHIKRLELSDAEQNPYVKQLKQALRKMTPGTTAK